MCTCGKMEATFLSFIENQHSATKLDCNIQGVPLNASKIIIGGPLLLEIRGKRHFTRLPFCIESIFLNV